MNDIFRLDMRHTHRQAGGAATRYASTADATTALHHWRHWSRASRLSPKVEPATAGGYTVTFTDRAGRKHGALCSPLYVEPPRATKVVRNLMSGLPVTIDADTPLCCDPSSETYWSM